MSGSAKCPHSDVHYNINLASFGDTNLRYVEISGRCNICDAKMRFRGRFGLNPNEPRVAIDGSEACLPVLFDDDELTGNPARYDINLVTS
jgi:hypothetical protein